MQLSIPLIFLFGFFSWGNAFPGQTDAKPNEQLSDGKNAIIQHAANLIDPDGKTSLHLAAEKGLLENAQLYLRNGALTNVTDKFGNTPLHYAAEKGHTEIATLLIENGANVNAKNNYQYTPLIYSAFEGHLETMELLIKKGADINVTRSSRRTQNLTLLHWTASGDFFGNHTAELIDAEIKQKVADLLIAHGANLNAMESQGKTPLMVAVEHNQLAMGEKFIKNGADINLVDDGKCLRWTPYVCRGGTALHWAIRIGRNDFVELLIKNDADLNIKDADGLTPLDLANAEASWNKSQGYTTMYEESARFAEMLKNAGAKNETKANE